jgi:hypothetical protein
LHLCPRNSISSDESRFDDADEDGRGGVAMALTDDMIEVVLAK